MSGSIKLKHASGNGVTISAPSSNPAADRTLELPSDADGVIAKTDSSGNLTVAGHLAVASGSDTTKGARITGGASGGTDIADFRTNNGTIRMKINNDVTVSTGNLVIGTSGKGIDFSATGSGSGTDSSELLNDYEEGSWTPSLGFGLSFTSASGSYSKIGDIVHAFCVLNHPNTSNANYVIVGGLPYTANSSGNCGGGFLRYSNYNGAEKLMFHVNNNSTSFIPYLSTGGGTITNATLSDKQVQVVLKYKTN